MLGLATGDAVGTTLEFKPRGSFQPITDMVGGGPFDLKPGQWTDDTSMALCLGTSLIHCNGFDARDQMNRYCDWRANGYMSSTGTCFDIGNTVSHALRNYRRTDDPFSGSTDPQSAGNGSLMRLAPVVLFYHPDRDAILHYTAESSRTTHGATEAIEACKILGLVLAAALDGEPKDKVLSAAADLASGSQHLNEIAAGAYRERSRDKIRGSGYVVDCLQAALWCFSQTDNFWDAILTAANLGEDADTTAAVCGQIAGAFYGFDGIPEEWIEKVAMRDEISDMAAGLAKDPCERLDQT